MRMSIFQQRFSGTRSPKVDSILGVNRPLKEKMPERDWFNPNQSRSGGRTGDGSDRSIGKSLELAPLLTTATILAVPFVLCTVFSGFWWFDDEGTLLIGFRSLLEGHRMYDEVYSLYGPLYNAVYGILYGVLHIPLTHTAGRLIAAALWLGYTGAFTVFCHRLTRSVPATVFCYLLVLLFLTQLTSSPGHPEEICLLMLATILLLVCSIERVPDFAAFAGAGAAIAGLALVKINIGAYVGGGLVLVLLRATVPTVLTRIAVPMAATILLLMPIAVQALLFDFVWVRLYCVFAVLTIGATLLAVLNVPSRMVAWPADWWIVVLASGVTCVIVVGGMMMTGSSAHAILEAVILQNAHFMRNWYVPLHVGISGLTAAGISVIAAILFHMTKARPTLRRHRRLGILILKSAFVLLGLVLFSSPTSLFLTLVPFSWLLMAPPSGVQQRHQTARGAAGLIGAMMSLYPFPVAGHQVNIGALLAIVMIPVMAHDVLSAIPRSAAVKSLIEARSTVLAMVIVLSIGGAATLRSALYYWEGVPLALPGTSLIRTDPEQAEDLRWVTARLSSCASSYSMPGMMSFAFWTGHTLPTALNNNDVLAFIRPAQQDEIVRALSRETDLCVAYNPEFLRWFDRGQIQTDPPLLQYLLTRFEAAEERHGFVILRRPSSGSGKL
jgi:hypothetical protein